MQGTVSKHGKKRGKERIGINKSSMDRQANLALERGIKRSQTDGRLHKWITSQCYLYQERREDVEYIVFNNKLFVFNGTCTVLITVLNLPTNLQKIAAKQIKKVNGNT